jgi:hypothetical protein
MRQGFIFARNEYLSRSGGIATPRSSCFCSPKEDRSAGLEEKVTETLLSQYLLSLIVHPLDYEK